MYVYLVEYLWTMIYKFNNDLSFAIYRLFKNMNRRAFGFCVVIVVVRAGVGVRSVCSAWRGCAS